jgi:hypothetical protein
MVALRWLYSIKSFAFNNFCQLRIFIFNGEGIPTYSVHTVHVTHNFQFLLSQRQQSRLTFNDYILQYCYSRYSRN